MSYDLEASVKKLRGMIKIIHFFIHELLLFSNEFIYPLGNLDKKNEPKSYSYGLLLFYGIHECKALQVCAYKSVNNGYSLNALNHSHMKCEHKSFLTLFTPN